MDMSIALNLDEIESHISENKFLMSFLTKYRQMDYDQMYQLNDRTYLEERMSRFRLTCQYEQ